MHHFRVAPWNAAFAGGSVNKVEQLDVTASAPVGQVVPRDFRRWAHSDVRRERLIADVL